MLPILKGTPLCWCGLPATVINPATDASPRHNACDTHVKDGFVNLPSETRVTMDTDEMLLEFHKMERYLETMEDAISYDAYEKNTRAVHERARLMERIHNAHHAVTQLRITTEVVWTATEVDDESSS